jgi:alpha-glucosidase (family GH31 glycosyl hydrolase)
MRRGAFRLRLAWLSTDLCIRSWRNLRGSQAIQLNAGLALMQSYGSDVGGFGGPLPDPELFVRWVQLGVTHSRFCIHSYKPDARDRSGAARTNTPWMVSRCMDVFSS